MVQSPNTTLLNRLVVWAHLTGCLSKRIIQSEVDVDQGQGNLDNLVCESEL